MKGKILSVITAISLMASYAIPISAGADSSELIAAFPGAEGAGMYATGGRGGSVYHVTNLNDSGTGSFRDAVSGSNRIVVFDVGGTITLKSDVVCKGNVTILGQTAPGGHGITLKNGKIGMGGDNIIVRYISSRPGEKGEGSGDYDAWGGSNGSNSIIDHCSIGWANDEQFGLYSQNMNQTVQYTIIGPSNCVSYHSKGAHGFGAMFGKGQNSWHHNLLCHSLSRNFRGKVVGTNSMDFVNNVIYDWGYQTAYGTMGHINYVNNYLKQGPSTKGGNYFLNKSSGTAYENFSFYLQGNTIRKADGSVYSQNINDDNWNGGTNGFDFETYGSSSAFAVADVNGNNASVVSNAETAEEAFESVTNYAGAAINAESRTKIDDQVLNEAKTGTGSLTGGRDFSTVTDDAVLSAISTYGIQYCDYSSYYPAATSKTITDSDNDGMPDEWEEARGLDPSNAGDATGDYLGEGYTNIEYYANDLTIDSFPAGVVTESPTTVDLGADYAAAKEDAAALKLSPTSITGVGQLTLPTVGTVNGSEISWASASSAVVIKNNEITKVTRPSSEAVNASLVATVTHKSSEGEYTVKKTFTVTVLPTMTVWTASSSDVGKAAGTILMTGLTNVSELTGSGTTTTIGGETFSYYVSGSDGGGWSDGAATGTAFKYDASEDGYLSAYITTLGENKTAYIVQAGAASQNDCVSSVAGTDGSEQVIVAPVEAGNTYYIYVAGSKGRFTRIMFDTQAPMIWWKASADAAANTTIIRGLSAAEDMTYSVVTAEIDGEPFTGYIVGTNNPGSAGATGAALHFAAYADGELTVYYKLGPKIFRIRESDGTDIATVDNKTGNDAGDAINTSTTVSVEAGKTYYLYGEGSKVAFYGLSFQQTGATGPAVATPAPTADPGLIVSNDFNSLTEGTLMHIDTEDQEPNTDIPGITMYIGTRSGGSDFTSYFGISSDGVTGNALVLRSGQFVSANRGPRFKIDTPDIENNTIYTASVKVKPSGDDAPLYYNDDPSTQANAQIPLTAGVWNTVTIKM
ncbi:MAG: immunoglobulin-like domain-containing protein [Candidatus Ornithomonoglobus sp.]